jgi:alanine dehydrogenase
MSRKNAPAASGTILILSSQDLQTVMRFDDYVDAVAEAFRMLAEGRCESPVPLQVSVADGTFHAKAANLPRGSGYVAVKVNGNFQITGPAMDCPQFRAPSSLPMRLTVGRWHFSIQSRLHASGPRPPQRLPLSIWPDRILVLPRFAGVASKAVFNCRIAWDIDPPTSRRFSAQMGAELGIDVTAVDDFREGTLVSDAIVTCTSSRTPFLGLDDVRPGTFVAAVGADNPQKSEIKPELMAKAAVIVDVLQQSIVMGDMHHAIIAGVMTPSDVRAELGALIAQQRPGRLADNEITIFDSSGTGVQDVAAAARAYELARDRGLGVICALA